MAPYTPQRRPRFFYGWVVVAGGFLNQVLNSGLGYQGFGTFLLHLEREFGWSKAQLAAARSLMQIENGLMGPVEGVLIDKFGPQKIMQGGMFLFGIGLILLSYIQTLWHYYAVFWVVAIGMGFGGYLVTIVAINLWFRRRRTLAFSISTLGLGVGGILVIPLLVWAQQTVGWREAAFASGLATWAIGIPAGFLLKGAPEQYGLKPDGESPNQSENVDIAKPSGSQEMGPETHFTLGEALRTPAYWLIGLGHSSSLLVISTVSVHQFAHMEQGMGISPHFAALMVGVMNAINMIGRLSGGILGDRFEKRYLCVVGTLGTGLSMIVFALASSMSGALLYASVYGFFWGLRGPLVESLRADYFGREHYGTIAGTSSLVTMPSSVLSPVFAGYLADVLGNYIAAFLILGIGCALGSTVFLFVRPPKQPNTFQKQ